MSRTVTFHKYSVVWKGGYPKTQIVEGIDIADALTRAGYGGGAASAVDSWRRLDDDDEEGADE